VASKYAVLFQEHHDKMKEADAVLDGAIQAGRALTDDEKTQVGAIEARLDELDEVLSVERQRRALQQRELAQDVQDGREKAGNALALLKPGRSIGASLFADDEFAAWHRASTPNGVVRSGVHIQSPRIEFGALAPLRGSVTTQAGALVIPDQYGLVAFPQRPLTIRDLVTNLTTNSDAVEYVETTSTTNNAATVAEADNTDSTDDTGRKPFSDMALARRSTTVKQIAHLMAATRRALADAPQIRGMLDTFGIYGLEEELEDQMVAGDATGENFDGILHKAGTTAQPFVTDILTTTRKARTAARLTGRVTPTAYAMNPADWETIDLLQDNEARYYYGGPGQMVTPRLWGLPVVESEAVPAGTAILADWRYAILWDREQGAIYVTDSHKDFFEKNLLAFLFELRAAFALIRPAAFVLADLTA
jgi:HK97 family phage major capsid protein